MWGGQLGLLGQLGNTCHFQCRNCGWESSAPADEPEPETTEDES